MITRMKNKYIIRSRISEAKFREILRYFCKDKRSYENIKVNRNFRGNSMEIFQTNQNSNDE